MIIAKTHKGKYFGEEIDNKVGWHGKPMKKLAEKVIGGIKKLIKNPNAKGKVTLPK
jgi:hypothetical protein